MKSGFASKLLSATLLASALTAPAQAAWLVVDDSDVDTITFSGGGFSADFYVNAYLVTQSPDQSGSVTFRDDAVDGFRITGVWDDTATGDPLLDNPMFAVPTRPHDVTTAYALQASLNGTYGQFLWGLFPYTGQGRYYTDEQPLPQDGRSLHYRIGDLDVTFISEAAPGLHPMPEPGSLALVGAALAGLPLARRRISPRSTAPASPR